MFDLVEDFAGMIRGDDLLAQKLFVQLPADQLPIAENDFLFLVLALFIGEVRRYFDDCPPENHTGMLESPINRNPARLPIHVPDIGKPKSRILAADDMKILIPILEELPGQDIP